MTEHSIAKSEIEPIGNGLYRVEKPFEAVCEELGTRMVVSKNYRTDGASIPPLLWPVIGHPLTGEFQDAAVEHDFRCDLARELGIYEARVVADALFFYKLRAAGVPWWKRTAMYLAVRANGWCSFFLLARRSKLK